MPDEPNRWAAEGTVFHTLIAECLDDPKIEPMHFFGKIYQVEGFEIECGREMVKHLEDGIDYVDSLPGRLFVEKKVSLDRWMPGEWGTTDVGLAERYRLTILDWKYGMIPVDAVDNEQARIYAMGLWHWLVTRFSGYDEIDEIRIIIRQPRVHNGNSEWMISLDKLLDFAKTASGQWELSRKGGPRTAGAKTCLWCKAKPTCKEYNRFVGGVIGAKFRKHADPPVELALPQANFLTPEQRAYILKNWPMVEKWHKALHADAINDAVKGHEDRIPGLKIIEGRRGKREWRDEDRAKRRLQMLIGEKAFETKVISPTEAEKNLTQEEYEDHIAPLIQQNDPKPVLVDEKAKGKPYKPVADGFKSLWRETEEEA